VSSSLPILIFDLDDTLIRSFPSYAASHQRVAGDLGWEVPTIPELVPYGRDWADTLSRLFPDRNVEAFMRRYDEIAHEHPYDALPGALEALTEVRRRGHSLYIVTKRDRTRLAARLAEAGIDQGLFEGIFPRESQPAPKPDPRCFEPVWAAIGIPHGAALSPLPIYVGDREEDRLAATSAGIEFVAVLTGPEASVGFPRDLDGSNILGSIAELPRWLE